MSGSYLSNFGLNSWLVIWRLLLLANLSLLINACGSEPDDANDPSQKGSLQNIVVVAGTRAVDISWSGVPGADGYTVYWSNQPGVTPQNGSPIDTVEPHLSHTELSNGLTYYYVITSKRYGGESYPSRQVSARPQAAIPTAVQGIEAKSENQRVRLRWDAVPGATSYSIYWSYSASVSPADNRIHDVESPFVHSDLENGQSYYYIIVAENDVGMGVVSEVHTAQPLEAIPIAPVMENAVITADTVQLNWHSAASDVNIQYDIYWSNVDDVSEDSAVIDSVSSPYTHGPLSAGQNYYYKVRARNGRGVSALSNTIHAQLPGTVDVAVVGAVPGVPGNISLRVENGQLSLSWDSAANAQAYNIYWVSGSRTVSKADNKIAAVQSPYTHIQLNNGTQYGYAVSAVNANGESDLSVQVNGSPEQIIAGVPAGLSASGSDESIGLHWLPVSQASEYVVYIRDVTDTVPGPEQRIAPVQSPLIINAGNYSGGLNNARRYRIQVTAMNGGSESARSQAVEAIPKEPPPNAPMAIYAEPGAARVLIRWPEAQAQNPADPDEVVTGYRLYYRQQAGVSVANGSLIPALDANGDPNYTQVTDSQGNVFWQVNHTGLQNNIRYYYIVTAVNSGGESRGSDQVWAIPQAPVPAMPSNTWAEAGDNQVIIHFTEATQGPAAYNLYWIRERSDGSRSGQQVTANILPGHVFTDGGNSNGNSYYFRLTTVTAGGESQYTREFSASPQPAPPQAPPVTVAASAQDSQVTINWTPVADADSYVLYWSTSADIDPSLGARISGPEVQSGYVHSGLSNGQVYYYRLAAQNAGGESSLSEFTVAMPQSDPPSQPANLTAVAGDGQVQVQWPNVATANSYTLYWAMEPGNAQPLTNWSRRVGVQSGTIIDGLNNGAIYHFAVQAHNQGGPSAPSNSVAAIPEPAAPASPDGFSAAPGDGQISLDWNTQNGVTYNLYWTTDTNPMVQPISSGNLISNVRPTHIINGLSNGTIYRYQLTANNAGGESPPSAEVSAMAQAIVATAPQALRAEGVDGRVILNWMPPEQGTGPFSYNVYWSTTPGVGTGGTLIADIAISSFTHRGLTNGQAYYYVVTAVTAAQESVPSLPASASPRGLLPSQIQGMRVESGNGQNTVHWQAETSASQYQVEWSLEVNAANELQGTINSATVIAPNTQYQHTGLGNDVPVYYRVSAQNQQGPGGSLQSGPVSVTVSGTPRSQANQIPQIQQGATHNLSIDEDADPINILLNAIDNDGDTLSWSVSTAASHGVAGVNGNGNSAIVSYAVNPNFDQSDQFEIQVSDGRGGADSIVINISVNPINDAPAFNTVLSDRSDIDAAPIVLDAGASDVESPTLSYSAIGLPPGLNINTATGLVSGTLTATASLNSPYAVTITVDDLSGAANAQTSASFNWTVNPVGVDPAQSSAIIEPATPITAGGTVNITITLRDTSGTAKAVGGDIVGLNISGANAALTASSSIWATDNNDGSYSISYTPTVAGTDSYDITVDISGTPQSLTGTYSRNIVAAAADPANSSATIAAGPYIEGQAIAISATVRDSYGNAASANVQVNITGVNATSLTAIAQGGGLYTTQYTPLNPGDDFVSILVDTMAIGSSPYTLPIGSANASPTDINLSNSSIAENSADNTVIGTLSSVDTAGDTHTYSFVGPNNDAGGRFAIVDNQLQVANGSLLDFETNTSHSISVRATDQGSLFVERSFTITVTNVPDVLSAIGINAARGFIEDASTFTLLPIVVTADADVTVSLSPSTTAAGNLFIPATAGVVINSNAGTGEWTASGAPSNVNTALATTTFTPAENYDSNFSIGVTVSGSGLPDVTGTKNMAVTAVNDAPVFNTGLGDQIHLEGTPVNVDASATDVDGPNLFYSATGLPAGLAINSGTGQITGTLGATASLGSPYTVDLSVNDQGVPNEVANRSITWTVTSDNTAPTDINLSNSSIAENSADNTVIGTLSSVDTAGDTHTYSFVGPNNDAGGRFAIVDNQLQVANGSLLDFETNTSHSISVRATDQGSLFVERSFTITVTNVPDVLSATGVNTAEAFIEDGPAFTLAPIVVTADANVSVSLQPAVATAGVITIPVTAGVTITAGAAGLVQADGAPANVNTALAATTFTPGANHDTSFDITVVVTNATLNVNGTKIVSVMAQTDPPVFNHLLPDRTSVDGDVVNIDASATDIESATLSYSAAGLPAGLDINTVTGQITGAIDLTASLDGPYPVVVTVDDLSGAPNAQVTTNFNWTVNPMTVDPTQTSASITPSADVVAGTPINITVTIRDANGTAKAIGGDIVTMNIAGANEALTIVAPLSATDNLNGTYSISYTPEIAGLDTYDIAVEINSVPFTISGSYSKNIVAAAADPNNSAPNIPVGPYIQNQPVDLSVTVSDVFGNPANAAVAFNISGQNFVGALSGEGVYSIQYTPTNVGTETINVYVDAVIVEASPYSRNVLSATLTANGINAVETLVENSSAFGLTPLELTTSDITPVSTTVTLTLSDVAAGTLQADAVPGVTIDFNPITGVLSLVGMPADVNVALSNVFLTPGSGYSTDFTIAVIISDSIRTDLNGLKSIGVIPLSEVLASSAFTTTPPSPVSAGTNVDLVLSVRDALSNPMDVDVVMLMATGSANEQSLLVANPQQGEYTASYLAANRGTDNFVISINGTTLNTEPFIIGSGPSLQSTRPVSDYSQAALNQTFSLVFDQAIDPNSVTGTDFTLQGGAAPVPGSVNVIDNKVIFTPEVQLNYGASYLASFTGTVANFSGASTLVSIEWPVTVMNAPQVISSETYANIVDFADTHYKASNGNIFHIWTERNLDTYTSYYRIYNALSGVWSDPQVFAGYAASIQFYESAAGLLVVYADGSSSVTDRRQIFTKFYSRGVFTDATNHGYFLQRSFSVASEGDLIGMVTTDGYIVNFKSYDPTNDTWSTPSQIHLDFDRLIESISLASNGTGFAVMWEEINVLTDESVNLIGKVHDGATWGTNIDLLVNFSGLLDYILAGNANGYAMLWSDGRRIYINDGSSAANTANLDDTTAGNRLYPRLISSPSGFAAFWAQNGTWVSNIFQQGRWGTPQSIGGSTLSDVVVDASGYHIAYGAGGALYVASNAGQGWVSTVASPIDTSALLTGLTLEVNGSNYAIIWQQGWPDTSLNAVSYAGRWYGVSQLDTSSIASQNFRHSLVPVDNGFTAFWRQEDGIGQAYFGSRINMSIVPPAWTRSGIDFMPPVSRGAATAPQIAINDAGVKVAVWRQTSDVGVDRVYYSMNETGTWQPPQLLDSCTLRNNNVHIATNGNSFMMVCKSGSDVIGYYLNGSTLTSDSIFTFSADRVTTYYAGPNILASDGTDYAVVYPGSGTKFRLLNSATGIWGQIETLPITRAYNSRFAFPKITGGLGGFAVNWWEQPTSTTYSASQYAATYNAGTWTPSTRISTIETGASTYQLTNAFRNHITSVGSDFLATWVSSDLYTSRFTSPSWSAETMVTAPGAVAATTPIHSASNGFGYNMVWGVTDYQATLFDGSNWTSHTVPNMVPIVRPITQSNGNGYAVIGGIAGNAAFAKYESNEWTGSLLLENKGTAVTNIYLAPSGSNYSAIWSQPDAEFVADPQTPRIWVSDDF
ncbi:MAG: putative Ig domain-containing protein [Gammaproteobacteria bacterium]|nr:putative Ig domain-containing protein [Gammaproteobacteria bacterium]